jgi:hypothetical protein
LSFSSRYIPLKTCTKCGSSFRSLQQEKELCSACSGEIISAVTEELDAFKAKVTETKKLPKGSWKEMQQFRDRVEHLEKDKNISNAAMKKLKDNLHSIYRYLIDQRRAEQEQYNSLVSELEETVEKIVKHSFEKSEPNPSVIDELKRTRNRLRSLSDDQKLGIRDMRKFMDKLHKASKNEEEKFEKKKKDQAERLKKWEAEEKKLEEAISVVEVGVQFSTENWEKLISLKKQINDKHRTGTIGSKGKKQLLSLVNHLMDQENILREMARQESKQQRRTRSDASHKTANDFKKILRTMNIGLGYSQELWNDLVALQREIIQNKQDGGMTVGDFKDVMEMVNEKLDTLKKLRSWSQ